MIIDKKKMRAQLEDLLADATEVMLTHGGQHPEHIQEGLDALKHTFDKVGIPFNATNVRIFGEGARCLFSMDTPEEQRVALGSFAVFARALRRQEEAKKRTVRKPAVKKAEAPKTPTKPVTPKQ